MAPRPPKRPGGRLRPPGRSGGPEDYLISPGFVSLLVTRFLPEYYPIFTRFSPDFSRRFNSLKCNLEHVLQGFPAKGAPTQPPRTRFYPILPDFYPIYPISRGSSLKPMPNGTFSIQNQEKCVFLPRSETLTQKCIL